MRRAVRLEVDVSRRGTPVATMHEYGRLYQVTLNVLRARVTERRAWYLLDVSGAARRIDAMVRLFRTRGLSVRPTLNSSYA